MSWLNLIILALAILSALAAIVSLVRALLVRSAIANEPYGVGRQESRRSMLVAFIRAAVLGVFALILLGVYGLNARPEDMMSTEPRATLDVAPTASATPETDSVTATSTTEPTATARTVTLPPAITSAPPTDTPGPTAAPTMTPTSVPSAVVSSEVGLYLRPEPGSSVELELLPDGAVLELLEGQQTVDGAEWQQVRSSSGNEGWVAVEFITYQ